MNKILNICKSYSGIREDITKAEEAIIMDMVNTEYHLKADDVLKAFKMNASGKYWEVVEAYNLFSPIYVGKVLTAYKEWRRKENMKPVPAERQLNAKPDKTVQEHFEWVKKIWDKEKRLPPANYSAIFKWLESEGKINLSDEEKNAKFEELKRSINNRINERRVKMQPFRDLEKELMPMSLKAQARKNEVREYLKGC